MHAYRLIICICCCSVAQSCPILCDLMDCRKPGFPVLHYLLGFAQTRVHWVDDATQSSHPLLSCSPQSFPASGSFSVSQVFASGGQNWSFSFIIICICSYICHLSQVMNSSNSTKWSLMSRFYLFFSFNWRINTLQYCDGPCHTSAWMGHRHTCVPSLLNPLPTSLPPYHSLLSQSTDWVPCVTHQTPSGVLFYIW